MSDSRKSLRPKRRHGTQVTVFALAMIYSQVATDTAGQFAALSIVILTVLDGVVAAVRMSRIKVEVQARGTYAADDDIPLQVNSSVPLQEDDYALRTKAGHAPGTIRDNNPSIRLGRGTYVVMTVLVARTSPLGLGVHERAFRCPVDLMVGPARASVQAPSAPGSELEMAGVRLAQNGDPRALIHWPSTARTQQLMVKEFAPAPNIERRHVHIIVGPGWVAGPEGEGVLERARGHAEIALLEGFQTTISTGTASGSITCRVQTRADVLRALAVATHGVEAPEIDCTQQVMVSGGGEQWSRS